MEISWMEKNISPNLGYVIGLLGVFYSTRAVKANELRKIRHSAFLDFSSLLSEGARIAEQVTQAKSSTDPDDEEQNEILDELEGKYFAWLSKMDIAQIAFELAAPNYVSSVGDAFYSTIPKLYEGKAHFRHYQYLWVRFQTVAKFDLRHFVWSYIRSVVFFFKSSIINSLEIIWTYVPGNSWLGEQFFKLRIVNWLRNRRNSKLEIALIKTYGHGREEHHTINFR